MGLFLGNAAQKVRCAPQGFISFAPIARGLFFCTEHIHTRIKTKMHLPHNHVLTHGACAVTRLCVWHG